MKEKARYKFLGVIMPRNRMIKCDFWTSEQVISCSPLARLLFIGLWNFADDHGVHPASYVKIKAEVFPGDNISLEDVKQWISELLREGLLKEYIVDEKLYWIVTGWKIHQKIERPTYRYPIPLSEPKVIPPLNQLIPDSSTTIHNLIDDNSNSSQQVVADNSVSTRRGVVERSTRARDEREKKEKRKEKHIREVETSPACVSDSIQIASKQLFEYWQTVMNHPRAVLDSKRQRLITQALKNYSLEELQQAIDGCKNTAYNMGKNDSGQVYDDVSLIFRNAGQIERFINNAALNVTSSSSMTSNDVMAGVI